MMEKLTIDDWNGVDQVSFYAYQSAHNPLVFSEAQGLWVANAYACCKDILSSSQVQVPQPGIPESGILAEEALLMLNNLVRINNGDKHLQARRAAMLLYDAVKTVNIGSLMGRLLVSVNMHAGFDWVGIIGRRLPVMAILNGLAFSDEDIDWVTGHMTALIKLMLPRKTQQDIEEINAVIPGFYQMSMRYVHEHAITERLLQTDAAMTRAEASDLLACNLLGLLIQSYDACRALLTISATTWSRLATERIAIKNNDVFFQKLTDELLRFDPPVHHTRRIALHDLEVNGNLIKQGEMILVVLGAANMDHRVFSAPERFDLDRGNNDAHITFGLGGHACMAKYFCRDMNIQTCRHIADRFGSISVLPQTIAYEPQFNVKIAKELIVSL